ncbi:carbohydrate ABC transporter permease [Cellulomonas sp. PhB150]|uniref:carbohydrate ABC transporter permease n=1 Tax=Cellulomonas sp. PhB150 TaxID=2485188 RepID=UPI000F4613AE|nr:carbohydrate ABC transporter permease [Cellulomonas sp. PhB150]ROS31255.1 cellobiose ABC transporter membrane protein [Cellulomonas sp. PhB150]
MSTPSVAAIEQFAGKGAARSAARRRNRSAGLNAGSERRPRWLTYVLLGLTIAISFYPLYYAFLLASSTASDIARHPIPSLIPGSHFFENVQRVLESDIGFWKAVTNSVIIAVITSLSVVLFSTLAGFSFAKLRFKGRGPLLVFVIATTAVPTQLGVVPLFLVMKQLGWIGQLQAVIVPGLVTAFGVFWMTQYLESALPYELIEAARVDGASMFRTFWSIALPAARPAATMLGLFTFVASWTNYFWPFIILGSANPTLPVALQLLQATFFKDMSLIMAGVVLSVIPLLLLFIAAGRQLVAGIMQGAVKG